MLSMEQTIDAIRRRNLQLLVAEFGTQSAVAQAAGTNDSTISHILISFQRSDGRVVKMGAELARRIEVGCGKPRGWMDVNHDDQPENELIQLYDQMDDNMRELLLNHARLIVKMKK